MNDFIKLNRQNRQAVRRTLELILPLADTFAFMFYNRFFEKEPAARPLFKEDMTSQRQKIIEMLKLALRGLEEPDAIREELEHLGRHHVQYHVTRQQYEQMNEAIIWAISETLGEKFNDEMDQAWQQALNGLTDIMLAAVADSKHGRSVP